MLESDQLLERLIDQTVLANAARKAGLHSSSIKESLKSFSGVPNRLEKLGSFHGISIFNDSNNSDNLSEY